MSETATAMPASMEEAEALVANMTAEELDQLLSGQTPVATPAPEAPVDPAAPVAPVAPEQKPAETEKKEEAQPDDLTPEIVEAAHPALKKMAEEYTALLEKHVELEQKVGQTVEQKYPDDPTERLKGALGDLKLSEFPLDIRIPVDVDKFLDELDAEEDRAAAKVKIAELLAFAEKEVKVRAAANVTMLRNDAVAEGESRAEARYAVERLIDNVPEWKESQVPRWVTSESGAKMVNREHPAAPFVQWLSESARTGVLTDAMVGELGMDFVYNAWKSKQVGGFGAHLGQIRKSATQEALDRMRGLKNKGLSTMQAKGLPSSAPNASSYADFHGFPLNELMSDPAAAQKALDYWSNTGNHQAINAFAAAAQGRGQAA